jgi:hypothetical protein
MKFDEWYEQQKEMIQAMTTRKDVAFYVWNNKPAKTSASKKANTSEDFDLFWEMYPNKSAKATALIAWNKTKPAIIDVVHALDWQTKQENWTKEGGKYIPMGSTYINQRRWEDVPIAIGPLIELEKYTDMNGITRTREKK